MLLPDFIEALQVALAGATADLIRELETQGHRNTGQLAASMVVDVRTEGTAVVGEVSAAGYLEYVNRRTRHQYISRAQIAGLTEYFQQRGLSGKDLQGAVWGTARKQVEIGSPLPGSYRYSQNGKRTGAIQAAFATFDQRLGDELGQALTQSINNDFTKVLNIHLQSI